MAAGKIDDLSEAERDAIISKLMNQEAKMICDPLVKAFLKCSQDRSFSLAWACRKEHRSMKDCIEGYHRRTDFNMWKQEYLRSINSKHAKPDYDLFKK